MRRKPATRGAGVRQPDLERAETSGNRPGDSATDIAAVFVKLSSAKAAE